MGTVLLQASRFETATPQRRFQQALCRERIALAIGRDITATFIHGLSHPCHAIEISHSYPSIFYDRVCADEEENGADSRRHEFYKSVVHVKSAQKGEAIASRY